MRMLNSEFNELARNPHVDLYPEAMRPAIDSIHQFVLNNINTGVYRTGFATVQEECELILNILLTGVRSLISV